MSLLTAGCTTVRGLSAVDPRPRLQIISYTTCMPKDAGRWAVVRQGLSGAGPHLVPVDGSPS